MVSTLSDHPAKAARAAAWYRANGKPDQAERLEAELVAGGRCRRCGRALSDPASLEAGVGPECAGKLGADQAAS